MSARESKDQKAARLRKEADAVERQGRYLLNIGVLFCDAAKYDEAVVEGDALVKKSAMLRERANRIKM